MWCVTAHQKRRGQKKTVLAGSTAANREKGLWEHSAEDDTTQSQAFSFVLVQALNNVPKLPWLQSPQGGHPDKDTNAQENDLCL